jgi:hypothetical protein
VLCRDTRRDSASCKAAGLPNHAGSDAPRAYWHGCLQGLLPAPRRRQAAQAGLPRHVLTLARLHCWWMLCEPASSRDLRALLLLGCPRRGLASLASQNRGLLQVTRRLSAPYAWSALLLPTSEALLLLAPLAQLASRPLALGWHMARLLVLTVYPSRSLRLHRSDPVSEAVSLASYRLLSCWPRRLLA